MALATRPKPSAHHKKRVAAHHRHSKPYLKTYWPYLPMLLIVGVGLAISSLWTNNAHILGEQSDFSASSMLQATNTSRTASNEPGLTLDTRLNDAAQAKASDMALHDYWAHDSPTGETPWTFITGSGYSYQLAGENLAYGFNDAKAVITGWMNSSEHRANILNANYTDVGFGVASAKNFQGKGPATIVVAEYGQPQASAVNLSFTVSPTPENTPVKELPAKPVSRIQMLTGGQATWSGLVLSAITGAALMYFVIRHGFRLRRLIANGEHYVLTHPIFDIAIVVVIMLGFVLTRASGVIR